MERRQRRLIIVILLAIVFVMTVAYATFSTRLTIKGSAEITSNWDVHIESITPGAEGKKVTINGVQKDSLVGTASNAGTSVTEGLTAHFDAEVFSPGDEITYTVKVINNGDLKAKLTNIEFETDPATTADDLIIYSYDGITIGDKLAAKGNAGDSAEFTVTAQFKDVANLSDVSDSLKEKNATLTLTYMQDKS